MTKPPALRLSLLHFELSADAWSRLLRVAPRLLELIAGLARRRGLAP